MSDTKMKISKLFTTCPRKYLTFLALLLVTGTGNFALPAQGQSPPGAKVIPIRTSKGLPHFQSDVLLVMPNARALQEEIHSGDFDPADRDSKPGWQKVIGELNAAVVRTIGEGSLQIVMIRTAPNKLASTAEKLSKDKHFSRVERNAICSLNQAAPPVVYNDEFGMWQYHLSPRFLNTLKAIPLSSGLHPKMCVIASGVDLTDPDLQFAMNGGTPPYGTSNFKDPLVHGTGMAMIAAATCNNTYGGASPGGGASRNMTIFSRRIADRNGAVTYFDILGGLLDQINNLADPKWPRVACLGAGPVGSTFSAPNFVYFHMLAQEYHKRGGTLLLPSGNDGLKFAFGRNAHFITVGGCDSLGRRAGFANYGTNIDCSAPAKALLTTAFRQPILVGGTSYAVAQVGAVAATLREKHPGWTPDQIRKALIDSCRQIDGQHRFTPELGFGIPDLQKALTL